VTESRHAGNAETPPRESRAARARRNASEMCRPAQPTGGGHRRVATAKRADPASTCMHGRATEPKGASRRESAAGRLGRARSDAQTGVCVVDASGKTLWYGYTRIVAVSGSNARRGRRMRRCAKRASWVSQGGADGRGGGIGGTGPRRVVGQRLQRARRAPLAGRAEQKVCGSCEACTQGRSWRHPPPSPPPPPRPLFQSLAPPHRSSPARVRGRRFRRPKPARVSNGPAQPRGEIVDARGAAGRCHVFLDQLRAATESSADAARHIVPARSMDRRHQHPFIVR